MVEAEAAISSGTSELRRCAVIKRSKVSLSDCVRLPEGTTKDPSLLVESLERALCNLAAIGRSLMEPQKVLQSYLEAFLPSCISAEPFSIEFPALRVRICSALIKGLSYSFSEGLQLRFPLWRIPTYFNRSERAVIRIC
jgi:hypothetical protein